MSFLQGAGDAFALNSHSFCISVLQCCTGGHRFLRLSHSNLALPRRAPADLALSRRRRRLAFDFNMAPSSGVSLDLFAVPPLCAVAACGGLPAADFCGLGVNAGDVGDPEVDAGDVGDPGVGAVACTGVAGVSVPAAPSVEAVAAAATEDDAAPSSLISSSFHSISSCVNQRLAFSCRLPYCTSRLSARNVCR